MSENPRKAAFATSKITSILQVPCVWWKPVKIFDGQNIGLTWYEHGRESHNGIEIHAGLVLKLVSGIPALDLSSLSLYEKIHGITESWIALETRAGKWSINNSSANTAQQSKELLFIAFEAVCKEVVKNGKANGIDRVILKKDVDDIVKGIASHQRSSMSRSPTAAVSEWTQKLYNVLSITEKSEFPIDKLPRDVLVQVLKNLSIHEIATKSRVSKSLHLAATATQDPEIVFQRKFTSMVSTLTNDLNNNQIDLLEYYENKTRLWAYIWHEEKQKYIEIDMDKNVDGNSVQYVLTKVKPKKTANTDPLFVVLTTAIDKAKQKYNIKQASFSDTTSGYHRNPYNQ